MGCVWIKLVATLINLLYSKIKMMNTQIKVEYNWIKFKNARNKKLAFEQITTVKPRHEMPYQC